MSGKSLRQRVRDRNPSKKKGDSGNITASGSGYFYMTGIVREFIGEPDVYLEARAQNLIKVGNHSDYEIMTKNSLIAYIIDDAESVNLKPPVICYPFFPHLSLPIKPGEHVWLLKEEFFGRDVYYWLSRKTGIKQTDDPNYTYAERFALIDEKLNKNNPKNKNENTNLFEEDVADELEDTLIIAYDNHVQSNLPADVNNNIIVSDSFAYRQEFTSEPVPPIRRKCGDALLMGSNNTIVHLTTEKFKLNVSNNKEFTGLVVDPERPLIGRRPFSPAIDLCVGRKKDELEQLKDIITPTGKSGSIKITKALRGSKYSELESYEIDKLGNLLDANALFDRNLAEDTDATNCGARLYLSNNCAIDETFGSSFDVLDALGGSGLATYADHNRVIADNSLRLTNRIGQSFLNMDAEGNVVIKSSINDGQQFLSLHHGGTTRLQARDTIEFAVSSDNDVDVNTVNEPYVLYSELRVLLESIVKDLSVLNALRFILTDSTPANPLMSILSIPEVINTALTAASGTAAANAQEGPSIDGLSEGYANALLKIGTGNDVTTRGTIASTKIFGESNDE